jgi:hypothetical protein
MLCTLLLACSSDRNSKKRGARPMDSMSRTYLRGGGWGLGLGFRGAKAERCAHTRPAVPLPSQAGRQAGRQAGGQAGSPRPPPGVDLKQAPQELESVQRHGVLLDQQLGHHGQQVLLQERVDGGAGAARAAGACRGKRAPSAGPARPAAALHPQPTAHHAHTQQPTTRPGLPSPASAGAAGRSTRELRTLGGRPAPPQAAAESAQGPGARGQGPGARGQGPGARPRQGQAGHAGWALLPRTTGPDAAVEERVVQQVVQQVADHAQAEEARLRALPRAQHYLQGGGGAGWRRHAPP